MKVSPVARYIKPSYPTHTVLDDHPELLKLVPRRWRGNPAVVAALTGVCLLIAGYKAQAAQKASRPGKSLVAPVFVRNPQHGTGRASVGGIGSAVYLLNEDEARQVITDEARRAGVVFKPDRLTLANVNSPVTDIYAFLRKDPGTPAAPTEDVCKRIPLALDGTDGVKHISYEYVSEMDVERWAASSRSDDQIGCTVSELDMLSTARKLRDKLLAAHPVGCYGVFYDPCITPADLSAAPPPASGLSKGEDPKIGAAGHVVLNQYQIQSAAAKTLAKSDLREQVRDFIKWLRAQGVM